MNIWEQLFLTGEYRARVDLLSGLTFEQVTLRPGSAEHSIYDELWHVVIWQRIVLARDRPAAVALMDGGENFPSTAPDQEQQWHDLVQEFLDGAQAAVTFAQAPDRLALEWKPGVTMAEELYKIAVHNAYHFGKIVALRQVIDAWPQKAMKE